MDTKVQKLSWKTEQRRVSDLVATSYNPRKISDEQKTQLTKSLEKFNLAEIPAINTDNTILAGHQRIAALIALGRGDETIDVRVPNRKLSKAEADEYLLRSNANTGDWDFDILGKDFEIDLLKDIGFPDFEIPEDNFELNEDKNINEAKISITCPFDVYEEILETVKENLKNYAGVKVK